MHVLAPAALPMEGRDVTALMSDQPDLTPHWLEQYRSGQVHWIVAGALRRC